MAQSPTLIQKPDGWWLHLPFEQRVPIAGKAEERRLAEPDLSMGRAVRSNARREAGFPVRCPTAVAVGPTCHAERIGEWMRNGLADLRRQREAVAAAEVAVVPLVLDGPAVPRREDPLASSAEQEAVRRIIARLAKEGQGLDEDAQAALARDVVVSEAGDLGRQRVEAIEREVLQSLGGRLGLLQPLMDDPEVTEIMVNRPDQVFVERGGVFELSDVRFRDDRSVQALVERIVGPLGRTFSVASPMVDARLADGSRVHAVRAPVALLGTTVTIRRFPRSFSLEELVDTGTFGTPGCPSDVASVSGLYPQDAPAWQALGWCVRHGANLVVAGGTGSGKTTMLNALSGCIPAGERVVIIEDAAELQPRLPHVVRLESRPANAEGRGSLSIQQLVVSALRMRPDRIVVGEVRDREALDMLLAMNTGHDGSLTTIHANAPAEVFHRLVQATALHSAAAVTISREAVVEIAATALKLIVQMVRVRGCRRVESVVSVEGLDGRRQPRLRVLYAWNGEGLKATGERPGWLRPDGSLRD